MPIASRSAGLIGLLVLVSGSPSDGESLLLVAFVLPESGVKRRHPNGLRMLWELADIGWKFSF
jgi:hypothetical protein